MHILESKVLKNEPWQYITGVFGSWVGGGVLIKYKNICKY